MARFLAYETLISRSLPRREDLQWLAGQIAALAPFTQGDAVVCGSVCWGSHNWRSDIDVAHFSTVEHPRLENLTQRVLEEFDTRTGHSRAAPQIDVVVIGAEEPVHSAPGKSLSAGAMSAGISPGQAHEPAAPRLFDDVAVRFADHIGAIAAMRADRWRTFYQRHLSTVKSSAERRLEDIRAYVSAVSDAWDSQPLHELEREADGSFTRHQLDLLGHMENYPVNLMRRMLAELARYPCPDRVTDVRTAFAALTDPWAQLITAAMPPFDALSAGYEALVTEVHRSDGQAPLSAQAYHDRLDALATALPRQAIQEAAWSYLKARG
jgi:hypothetical protein